MIGRLLLLLSLVGTPSMAAPEKACPSPFFLETNPALSLTELKKLADPDQSPAQPKTSSELVFQMFDDEDYPTKAGRHGIAIVYGNQGGLAEDGVGGLLWSKVDARVDMDRSAALSKANGKANLVFVTKESYGGRGCGRATFIFTMDNDQVYAGGRKLGSITRTLFGK